MMLVLRPVTGSVTGPLSNTLFGVSNSSHSPQLVDTVSGRLLSIAAAKASTNPWLVFGAWYTTIFAPGAMPPDCSTSSVVSSEPESSLGAPGPPSIFTTVKRLGETLRPSAPQYANASVGVK